MCLCIMSQGRSKRGGRGGSGRPNTLLKKKKKKGKERKGERKRKGEKKGRKKQKQKQKGKK